MREDVQYHIIMLCDACCVNLLIWFELSNQVQ